MPECPNRQGISNLYNCCTGTCLIKKSLNPVECITGCHTAEDALYNNQWLFNSWLDGQIFSIVCKQGQRCAHDHWRATENPSPLPYGIELCRLCLTIWFNNSPLTTLSFLDSLKLNEVKFFKLTVVDIPISKKMEDDETKALCTLVHKTLVQFAILLDLASPHSQTRMDTGICKHLEMLTFGFHWLSVITDVTRTVTSSGWCKEVHLWTVKLRLSN